MPATNGACDPGVTIKYGSKKGRLVMPARVFVEYLNKGHNRRRFNALYAMALYSDDRDVLWFCSPGRKDMRHDFTIWVSFDGGKTWSYKKLVKSGPGNYPWMAVGRPGTPSENMVYVLAGKDWCARFNLAWLLSDNEDRPTVKK